MGSALFHGAVSTVVLLAFRLLMEESIPATALLLPVVLLPLLLLAMGLSWFLASLGVYLRDIGQVTGVLTTILLFLSPVFYPVSALPESYRGLFQLNPLTPAITQARDTLLLGTMPDWTQWGLSLGAGLGAAWIGLAWFQKTRRGFADVI
jgi:lipopolysaccharide transport system permease protein